jgi:serine/threonine protein phosphatase 1
LIHGGQATVDAYGKTDEATRKKHVHFLTQDLENYYLDAQNRLFLHAGFTNLKGVDHEYFSKTFYWDRTLWELALSLHPDLKPEDPFYPKRLLQYPEIFIGHTPLTRIGKTEPMQAASVWNLDTGAAFTGPLTLMDIDSKIFWQSDPVYTLYPNENGRN